MLIITAKNDSQWRHDLDDKLYGAVLQKDLLHEVRTYYIGYDVFFFIIRPCCSRSAAAYSHQTFP